MRDITSMTGKQKEFFLSGKTKEISFRRDKLILLRNAIKEHEKDIYEALRLDLGKAPFEAYVTEVGIVLEEITYALKHLKQWAKPRRVRVPLMHFPSSGSIHAEPYGSVLIMSPWNYPFQLTIVPLAGAIAAGNCAIIKPSEYAFHTSEIIEKIISEIFEESFVSVIRGGREANKSLLNEKFDYIFFTGSPQVGKVVMESAARHLVPVTLELGGKSPCIVDESADIKLSARRIIWGKFLNAGQTCIAPDYLLVHSSVKNDLLNELKASITAFYGQDPLSSKEYPKIISQRHFDRLMNLMESGRIIVGGRSNSSERRIAPTILEDVSWDSPIMQEEIFGPILPILEFTDFHDTLATLSRRPKPLAFYLFTSNRKNEAHAIRTVSFGGGCINDTMIHLSSPRLPFGGVGESGMGQYHGKTSFDTFSHYKSIIKKFNLLDSSSLRYPPFKNRLKLAKKFMGR
ncbi:aldehyde dehydrogenase [Sphaerochaeta coccoides]|uniref:Aldehyde dehydrogenase n=1 Tax=Parasphaerochaeta coccoides (strain ATCC BAA-1237 / DSM 17374 / SPN1) TaxID=760011 RepID=F4GI03_PARC1|nr:Aldehyde Dehydrogenase [Parasphaerochaeta coccoides DSM 17374]